MGPRVGANAKAEREVILGTSRLVLQTVGIDVGSATSQIVFSLLTLEDRGNRYETVERTIRFASEPLLTPLKSDAEIDADALARYFEEQFAVAGIRPDEVQTGAVILTGMALRRQNAAEIARVLAQFAGRFVSVAAGDEMEAILAAHGSGAVELSKAAGPILNVDIGGGTTKFALCADGQVTGTAAIDIGARLIAWDDDCNVTRLEPTGDTLAELAGVTVKPGSHLTGSDRRALAALAAQAIVDGLDGDWDSERCTRLLRTPALEASGPCRVVFSGGGATFMAGGISGADPHDLGPYLAECLRTNLARRGADYHVVPAAIRATVIGASQYSVQVSGTTIHVSGPRALPLRNIPVSVVSEATGDRRLSELIAWSLRTSPADGEVLALAVPWRQSPSFNAIDHFCREVVQGLPQDRRLPDCLVLFVDDDVAGLVGAHMVEECGWEKSLVVIDGVTLSRFDFVDVGEFLPHSPSLSVTVKSLAFVSSGMPAPS